MAFQEQAENSITRWCNRHFGVEKFTRGFKEIAPLFEQISRRLTQKGVRIITIGGTNGKGETVFTLGYLLSPKNLSVGLWTSPHILSICERFVFCQKGSMDAIGHKELQNQMEDSFKKIQKENKKPSYYEFFFFVFCELCLARKVEVMVLEVGLGGRLDAVNLLNPQMTALTSLSRDHENILGRGYTSILREKLGISRPQIPLITCLSSRFCRHQVQKHCSLHGIDHYDLFSLGLVKQTDHYSLQNKKLAFFIKNLFLQEDDPLGEISSMDFPFWPGRRPEIKWKNCRFFFRGAHNLDGMRKIMQYPDPSFKTIFLAFSNRPLNEISACLTLLNNSHTVQKIFLTRMEHPKGWQNFANLPKFFKKVEIKKDWKKRLSDLRGSFLVTGSYYFIGEFKRYLLN